ncbi:hypothetical protein ARALYDRAFT_474914 [Arabidopsis lyrata subsp. lyrata]|uniref:Uncharacterized protein n=1 Tax=Arabidopsis lyrata subsp. lyrata TaxID=81972 RepID=D7KSB0_ARALL|nr:uncharacterized protein LOC9323956 [Arabidopsis lyrata subsp. lyrata]XP_020890668.1 uncharacterized protein LOC9323956 [Arabidopsis lyrata subsp. lyrata]EFH64152.1 hypothetical protein ARALYDRAFT_474914 [Arabidopsis lyrata subsp. lyrata]|eukprot:XP_020890667.1 uncharacterized protein LOC9323956 [Arabidopsis lyrata subsp. lyrata]
MSFRKVEKKPTEMGRQMTHEKSDSDSDNEGTPMTAGGYTEFVARSDSDWDEPFYSGKARSNLTTKETGPTNSYSRKHFSNN